MPHDQLGVCVAASWFPAIDDVVAGRFVADQVEGLATYTDVRPSVVTFEAASLVGSGSARTRIAAAVTEHVRRAIATGSEVFATGGGITPAVPIARLQVPSGRTGSDPVLHAYRGRAAALSTLAGRWMGEGPPIDVPRPSVIHAHTGYPDGAAAAVLAERLDLPLVITEHATFLARLLEQPAIRASYVSAAHRAARLVVVSDMFGREVRRLLPEVADRVVVVPNAVDVESFRAEPLASRRHEELLFVGYLKEIKGIDLLLAALAIVRRTNQGASLRLIGSASSELLTRWMRLAGELGVSEAVAFDPPADRAGVAAAMARASLFVHASRRETFGVVAAEALASGTPVIATDSGGVTEILDTDPGLGTVVPRDDPAALARAIIDALKRREAFDPEYLRASVVDRFSKAAVARSLSGLYEAVREEYSAGGNHATLRPPFRDTAPEPEVRRLQGEAPIVVVALDPARARLVNRLPESVRARLILVTSGDRDGASPVVSPVAAVILAPIGAYARVTADVASLGRPDRVVSRIFRAVQHPLAAARRRGLIPGLEHAVLTRGTRAINAGLVAAQLLHDGPPAVICVDGLDHLAAAPLVAVGDVVMMPGGLRHLADLAGSGTSP